MLQYRTDLAMEAHELLCAKSRAQTLSGVDSRTVFRRGCSVTSVRIDTEGAARQLGKPRGRYVTLDLSPLQKNADDVLERASRAVGAELRALLGENVKSVLVAGLGNANMTPECSSLTRASSQAAAWAITGVPSAATRSACRSTPSAFPRSSTRRR